MVAVDSAVVVLASGNAGKLRELSRILSPLKFSLQSQAEFDMPEVVEDGLSFVENAIIKARAVAKFTGHATIADLFFEILGRG
jgi:XTP/dITP diphosphohydrolase